MLNFFRGRIVVVVVQIVVMLVIIIMITFMFYLAYLPKVKYLTEHILSKNVSVAETVFKCCLEIFSKYMN